MWCGYTATPDITSHAFRALLVKSTVLRATLNDASALDRDDFITLLSAELHCHGKLYDRDGLWHIVANGLPPGFAMAGETETGPELVSRPLRPVPM